MFSTLVVEDSADCQNLIKLALDDICALHCVDRVFAAREILQSQVFDLVLVDLELLDGPSFSILSYIQSESRFSHATIIVMSAQKEIEDKLLCFNLGAKDYIVKPVDRRELRARVLALTERGQALDLRDVQVAGLLIKKESHQVFTKGTDSQWVQANLTPLEYRLLLNFIDNHGQVLSRHHLIDKGWGGEIHVTDRTVDSHVCALRKKLGEAGDAIQTVYGEGYVFKGT